MLSAFVWKEHNGRGNPGSRSLSNALLRKREARAFPPKPSEECGAGAHARELSPSPPQPGYFPQAMAVGNSNQL